MVPANAQRIAIVGSREYKQLDQVREYVRSLPLGVIVISGGARGVDRADKLVAFWDGHSRGTSDTMARAKRKGIEVDLLYASGKQKEA